MVHEIVDLKVTLCVQQDPLNSGDDVFEQDIPDLFDSENVIVCQYDKVRTRLSANENSEL